MTFFTNIKTFWSRPEALLLIISAGFTAVVAAMLALPAWLLLGINFFAAFAGFIALQLIVFWLWNSAKQQKDLKDYIELMQAQAQIVSTYTIKIPCAYCKTPNEALVRLNERNTFKCPSCNQTSSVQMAFTATQVTTPIESVKIPTAEGAVEFKV